MSERKVISKYFPPDFDYRQIQRRRGRKESVPECPTVRMMAPFSMRCTKCGEYISKGTKFNARKETPDERYLGLQIFRFHIRCTRCSAEITFKTDLKHADYTCECGAKRCTEAWHRGGADETETDEQRLDRLEVEGKEEEARDAMEGLEAKAADARCEMAVADALDEIRTRNARRERSEGEVFPGGEAGALRPQVDELRIRKEEEEEEDAAAWARARERFRLKGFVEDEMDVLDPHGCGTWWHEGGLDWYS